MAVEETVSLQSPVCDDSELVHDAHSLAPADLLEVPGVVVDLVLGREGVVDEADGFPERRPDRRFPRSPLPLPNQVQTQNRTPVPLEEIAEVLSGREVDRIDLRDEDRRPGDHGIALLGPEKWNARPALDLGSELALLRITARAVMQNLLRFDVVRDVAFVVQASFQIPRPGEKS